MSKYTPRVHHKDAIQDHSHSVPEGGVTGGMLMKPVSPLGRQMHTHLYQDGEKTEETEASTDDPGHTHECDEDEYTGPAKPLSQPLAPTPEDTKPKDQSGVVGGVSGTERKDAGRDEGREDSNGARNHQDGADIRCPRCRENLGKPSEFFSGASKRPCANCGVMLAPDPNSFSLVKLA